MKDKNVNSTNQNKVQKIGADYKSLAIWEWSFYAMIMALILGVVIFVIT